MSEPIDPAHAARVAKLSQFGKDLSLLIALRGLFEGAPSPNLDTLIAGTRADVEAFCASCLVPDGVGTAAPDIALTNLGDGHYIVSPNIEAPFVVVDTATPGDTAPLASDSDTAEVPA